MNNKPEMLVDAVQAYDHLKSALTRLDNQIDKIVIVDETYTVLIDVKKDLKKVELYIEDMSMLQLMNAAMEEIEEENKTNDNMGKDREQI